MRYSHWSRDVSHILETNESRLTNESASLLKSNIFSRSHWLIKKKQRTQNWSFPTIFFCQFPTKWELIQSLLPIQRLESRVSVFSFKLGGILFLGNITEITKIYAVFLY